MNIYSTEAFVYVWTNHTKNKKYIGYHKGTVDDGYVCSSRSDQFWNDWKTDKWSREIVATGTQKECIELEHQMLREADLKSGKYYNIFNGRHIIMTEEVRQKISDGNKGKPAWNKGVVGVLSSTRKGVERSTETKDKIRRSMKEYRKNNPVVHSEETKRKLSLAAKRRWEKVRLQNAQNT